MLIYSLVMDDTRSTTTAALNAGDADEDDLASLFYSDLLHESCELNGGSVEDRIYG